MVKKLRLRRYQVVFNALERLGDGAVDERRPVVHSVRRSWDLDGSVWVRLIWPTSDGLAEERLICKPTKNALLMRICSDPVCKRYVELCRFEELDDSAICELHGGLTSNDRQAMYASEYRLLASRCAPEHAPQMAFAAVVMEKRSKM